jgi:hypothetical protein
MVDVKNVPPKEGPRAKNVDRGHEGSKAMPSKSATTIRPRTPPKFELASIQEVPDSENQRWNRILSLLLEAGRRK